MRSKLLAAGWALVAASMVGCFGAQDQVPPAETPDGSDDAPIVGDDGPGDVMTPSVESGVDATAKPEAASPEAGPDQTAPQDAGEDAPPEPEAEVEAEVDAVAGAEADAAPEPAAEAAVEAEATAAEAGPDATAVDASADAPLDAPPEASDASDTGTFCVAAIYGDHYVRPDGELIYGPNGTHTVITSATTSTPLLGITEVVQQSGDHACGLRASDGTVWCWALSTLGGNANGDLGNGSFGGTNLGVGVATEVVTNAADAGAPVYLTGVVHLSTASDTYYTFPTCAIRSDKTVWCWGDTSSEEGDLFQGTTGSNASVPYAIPIAAAPGDGGPPPPLTADQVSVGARHACVLLGGQVSCWGQNISGNLANGDVSLAYKAYPQPVVPGYGLPATVDAIGSGYDFTCALAGGQVWCWGTNGWDQIGDPSAPRAICNSNYCQPQPTPVQASVPDGGMTPVVDAGVSPNPLSNITSIVIGYQFGCALDTGGDVWCWGAYSAGVSDVAEATPFTSTMAPYTGVTQISGAGEGIGDGLRYTTASGVYVAGGRAYAPYCQ
jgi:alpha-tubulin suppressor-like RCC1 family protein